ncbi:MAG: LacI family DNA-binding transcriptional regulator [Anaerolineae bacterium]
MMAEEKLTIRQIAALAGVSRSTVSRVINDHPNVSPDTREQVLQVVADTGFRPDPIARSLSSRRAGIIGLVIPLAIQSLFEDPFFARLMQGISQGCNMHDYTLALFLLHSLEEEAKLYPRISRRQLLDGVIVTATQDGDPLIPQLLANRVPFVLHGRHEDSRISFVDIDNVTGAYTAVTHLVRLGRRRIALITGPSGSLAAEDRKRGYLDALLDRRVPVEESLILHGDFTETSSYQAMQRLLPHEPDAVFVASDSMALGALRALREAGKRVPDEVAVVGFDNMPQAATADPPLTTIRQPIQQTGILAVEMLIDILENGADPARRIILPTELVIRASCGSGLIG